MVNWFRSSKVISNFSQPFVAGDTLPLLRSAITLFSRINKVATFSSSLFSFPGNVGVNTSTPNASLHVGGDVYIGTSAGTPATGYKLSVKGKIICEEAKVQLSASWPDYVFADNYQLMSLDNFEKNIKALKHLPNIPAAKEMEANGIELGDMNRRLLEKVEELSLYIIQLNNRLKTLEKVAN